MNRLLILLALFALLVALYNRDQIQNMMYGEKESEKVEECVPSPIPSEDELYRFAHGKLNRST